MTRSRQKVETTLMVAGNDVFHIDGDDSVVGGEGHIAIIKGQLEIVNLNSELPWRGRSPFWRPAQYYYR